jgi:hypothetical protein
MLEFISGFSVERKLNLCWCQCPLVPALVLIMSLHNNYVSSAILAIALYCLSLDVLLASRVVEFMFLMCKFSIISDNMGKC